MFLAYLLLYLMPVTVLVFLFVVLPFLVLFREEEALEVEASSQH